MTIMFQCDSCGEYMGYAEERSGLFFSMDKERKKDLCPKCAERVEQFIEEGIPTQEKKRIRK